MIKAAEEWKLNSRVLQEGAVIPDYSMVLFSQFQICYKDDNKFLNENYGRCFLHFEMVNLEISSSLDNGFGKSTIRNNLK